MTSLSAFAATLSQGECALIFSPVGRQYLSQFRSTDGALVVFSDRAVLFLDSRYYEMACLQQKNGLIPKELLLSPDPLSARFDSLCRESLIERVLLEDRELTVARWNLLRDGYPSLSFEPLGDRLELLRMVKTRQEIEKIRTAQALAEDAYRYVLDRLEIGRTEIEIAAELEYYMKKNGASGPSFETICVSGSRSSLPHGRAESRPITQGFLTMDFGCVVDGYCSDITRTVCLGRASDEMRKVYQTVLDAQLAAIRTVRAGVTGKAVDAAARDLIAAAGYGKAFGHSTGHGIGLMVHEAPSFSPKAEGVIPAGAVLSVEPGIYLEGSFGVRIEDLVVVTETGCENLNRTSKELLEI